MSQEPWQEGLPPHLFGAVSATQDESPLLPKKIFAQPFRLAFKKDEDVTWIEVGSLSGLRSVTEKLATGELVEIDRFSSLEMQLWGHLAEHTGFLRVKGSPSALAAGIQPLGEEAVALAEDLSAIMGGDDVSALDTLGDMRDLLGRRPIDNTPMVQPPVTHEFVKPDGVNLTTKGEDVLHELVMGNGGNQPERAPRPEVVAFEKERENAIEIFLAQTPNATPEEIEAEKVEAIEAAALGELKEKPVGKVTIGKQAAIIGRHVAAVGRGLDNADDEAVRVAARTALAIMGINVDDPILDAIPSTTAEEFMDYFGVSVADLHRLATALPNQRTTNEQVTAQRIKDAYSKMDVSRVEPKSSEDQWEDALKRLRDEEDHNSSQDNGPQQ